jgi:hypothetical protein
VWNDVSLAEDAPPEAGCSWPVVYSCTPAEDAPALDAALVEWTEQMAIEVLWALSGRQFGLCTTTYRPCRRSDCIGGFPYIDAWNLVGRGGSLSFDPWGGSVFAVARCGCGSESCSCTTLESIELWHKRVRAVTEVTIDGVVLDPANYRLSKNRLLRTDGEAWPSCQDWEVDLGQPGSWGVTVVHGRTVPIGGRVSAGLLATEYRKACAGDDSCELPRRIQTNTRAGQTFTFVDPMLMIDKGSTGLTEVDMWLHSVNPNRLQRRARVYRVDDERRRAVRS